MELEDIGDDFEFAGNCVVCEEMLDLSEVGFCKQCGGCFCWGNCGGWNKSHHCCCDCIDLDDDEGAEEF